jgi:hypothetical protein
MRVVLILVVLVGALFFHVASWLKPFSSADLKTEYEPYILEAVNPADAEGRHAPTRTVD